MTDPRPPRVLERLLEALLPETRAAEAVLGDLAEEYAGRARRQGALRAGWWYWRQGIAVGALAAVAGLRQGGGEMGAMFGDVRYAVRALRRNPGFAAIVVLTLGLGVGANSAVYSVIHGTLIQALPYDGGGIALVQLRQPSSDGTQDVGFSVQEILGYKERSSTIEDVAEYHRLRFNLVGVGDPQRVEAGVVSANYFELLGVKARHGRLFGSGDEGHDATPVIVLTYDFWMNQMGGDPDAVGRSLEMNGMLHTVIGVLPPVPLYPSGADIFITTTACPFRSSERWVQTRTVRAMSLFARLRSPDDLGRLRTELETVSSAMHEEFPEAYPENRGLYTAALPLRDALVEDARGTFMILLATAALVLLIAVANIANLTFARLVRRERELSLRAALGAGRRRIVKLVLTEAALVGLAGGILGLLLAAVSIDLLSDFAARYTTRAAEIEINTPVLLFTLATAVGAGLLSGLLPTLVAFRRWRGGLRVGGVGTTDSQRRRRLQAGLVVAQVATSFVLLIGAGLTIRSLQKLYAIDPGFSTDQVLSMEIPAPFNRTAAESNRFYQDLLNEVRALPTVQTASVAMTFPLDGLGQMATSVQIQGREVGPDGTAPRADIRTVSTGYFETMGIPIVQGRAFTEAEQLDAAPVAVVNQAFATRLFPNEDPLGEQVSWDGGSTWLNIVGVAGDVRHYGMDDAVEMEVYQPRMMMMNSLLVRTSSDPTGMIRPITEVVRSLNPKQPVTNVATMAARRSDSLAPARLITTLLGIFAGLAALITAAGIGGVIAFTVSQRTKELGIRIALGSSRTGVLALLFRQGLAMTVVGVGIGVMAALGLGRYMESILYGVETRDPLTFAGVALGFLVITAVAVLLPAQRATRIDVRDALTTE